MKEEQAAEFTGGPQELGHEPVKGYGRIFYIAFAAAALYLGAIFIFGAHLR